jgi:hypothetical protein
MSVSSEQQIRMGQKKQKWLTLLKVFARVTRLTNRLRLSSKSNL